MVCSNLVVLGSSLTALAVLRNADKNAVPTMLFDTHDGIAAQSRLAARIQILKDAPEVEIRRSILELGEKGTNHLIATSDRWLRFVVAHRADLDKAYQTVLHADNAVLDICLNKPQLASWCEKHAIQTPRRYPLQQPEDLDTVPVELPVLLRPAISLPAGTQLPKALEVRRPEQLRDWLQRYRQEGVPVVVTESLLGHRLTQYSVGLARDGARMASFVAIKARPLPEDCAVGTFVELAPNGEVEAMARSVAERLDYFGIAEIEILYCHERRQGYLIEINARPWIQYALAMASGHDFLEFLLAPQRYDRGKERKQGKRWLDMGGDFFNCFSRSVGLVRNGRIGVIPYLKSLVQANVHSKFSLRDPRPFWYDLKNWLVFFWRANVNSRGMRWR
jgi:predicted ATP-grasp superfamily ATP-dependent carboligase